jgi:hypothetical protein
MSVSLNGGAGDVQIVAGGEMRLRVSAYDPNGVAKVFIQCFQFSLGSSSKSKLAFGELIVTEDERLSRNNFEVRIQIPQNAALGKWGVQMIEFTNCRGYKTSFYRGQGKFDNILFEVIPPPSKENELLRFYGVEIADSDRYA